MQTLPALGVAKLLTTAEKGSRSWRNRTKRLHTASLWAVEALPLNYHGGAFNRGPRTGGPKKGDSPAEKKRVEQPFIMHSDSWSWLDYRWLFSR